MLVWRMENAHDWQVKPGAHGKGLKQYVEPELWSELESAYVGAGRAENWDALYRTMTLFREVAIAVAGPLGYRYPDDLDGRVRAYIKKIENTDERATEFTGLA